MSYGIKFTLEKLHKFNEYVSDYIKYLERRDNMDYKYQDIHLRNWRTNEDKPLAREIEISKIIFSRKNITIFYMRNNIYYSITIKKEPFIELVID